MDVLTGYNVALMQEVVPFLVRNPDRHNQSTWLTTGDHVNLSPYIHTVVNQYGGEERTLRLGSFEIIMSCGTTGCLAGWTVVLNDNEVVTPNSWLPEDEGETLDMFELRADDGEHQNIEMRAQEQLGISDEEGSFLFDGDRTIEQIVEYLEALTNTELWPAEVPRRAANWDHISEDERGMTPELYARLT